MKSFTKITKLIFAILFVVASFSCSTLNAMRQGRNEPSFNQLTSRFSQLPPDLQQNIATYVLRHRGNQEPQQESVTRLITELHRNNNFLSHFCRYLRYLYASNLIGPIVNGMAPPTRDDPQEYSIAYNSHHGFFITLLPWPCRLECAIIYFYLTFKRIVKKLVEKNWSAQENDAH